MPVVDKNENYGRHLVRSFAAAVSARTVLDLGAGHGHDLNAVKALKPEARCFAIEHHPPYQAELAAVGVEVHGTDIEREPLPFADGSIDLVIANQIFEHLKEVFWVNHQIARVVPVGGHAIIGVPNLASLHNRLLLLLGRQPTCAQNWSAHVRGFTRRDLLALLDRPFPGGWRQLRWGGGNFYPFPRSVARPLARILPGLAWSVFILVRKERAYNGEYLRWPGDNRLETNFRTGPA